jgi:hypothetical protein
MLGWTVAIKDVDEEEPRHNIAYWYAEPQFLTEIEKLVEEGEAFVDEYHGGYPNKYSVYSDILREWLEDNDPRLHVYWGGRSIYKLSVDYDKLDHILDGVLLSVELWDQS